LIKMKQQLKKYSFLVLFSCLQCRLYSQAIIPDVQDTSKWRVINRSVEPVNENGKKAVRFNEMPDGGFMILQGVDFSNGTIDVDIKGNNKFQQSFVGIAFHGQDLKTYDAVYFRPFNFGNADSARRYHAVQYISMPQHDWSELRSSYPGKYENKIDPAPGPDDWFHARIVVEGKQIMVFVNNEKQPSLKVEKLNTNNNGGFALWLGNNSGGSFANLKITPATFRSADVITTEPVPYGNNPTAGHYFNVGDANIYYEIYGRGEPVVMLHGGVYGYIDEFEPFIKRLAENYQVICIATRGHGKSQMGNTPFTYKQRTEDAYKVIRSITKDSVTVIGFSDGGFSGLKLAALYPELVKKLGAIGVGDRPQNRQREKLNYTKAGLMKYDSAFFTGRLKLMPEPDRWEQCLTWLTNMYNNDYMSKETFEEIQCPVLLMNGDKDDYSSIDEFVQCAKYIRNVQTALIPACHHVIFFCNFPAVWESLQPFLKL